MPRQGLPSRADSTGSAKLALKKALKYLATCVPAPGSCHLLARAGSVRAVFA